MLPGTRYSRRGHSIFVTGTNTFDEKLEKRGRFENQWITLQETGARFSAGFRVKF